MKSNLLQSFCFVLFLFSLHLDILNESIFVFLKSVVLHIQKSRDSFIFLQASAIFVLSVLQCAHRCSELFCFQQPRGNERHTFARAVRTCCTPINNYHLYTFHSCIQRYRTISLLFQRTPVRNWKTQKFISSWYC